MEMIDVLRKLQEIAETKPELVKDAVESVEKTNPKEVNENAVESETPVNKEPVKEYEDKIREYSVGSFKDFLKGKGIDIYNLKQQDYSKYAQEYKAEKDKAHQDATSKKGSEDHKTYTPSTKDTPMSLEGGISDIHIGAQEVVGDYVDDDGNLTQPKAQVLQAMKAEKDKAPFPRSYEIETAMQMVADKFDDNGQAVDEVEPEMASVEPEVTEEPAKEDMWGNTGTKAFFNMGSKLDIEFSMEQKGMMAGVLNRLDQDVLSKAVDEYKSQELDPDQAESKELNTTTMKTEDKKPINESKKPVKEAIQISTDSPEEAGVMMQILKLAGVKPVDDAMIGAEPQADAGEGHDHSDCPVCADDAVGSGEMGKIRDVISQNDTDEKAEETFDNEPDEKVADVDTLVNVHSGGLNKQKQQVRKEYPGDNPLAVKEDTISEEDLANSFRAQYEDFKTAYQEAAKPDFLDMDKDGNKKEPMKKAVKDKETK